MAATAVTPSLNTATQPRTSSAVALFAARLALPVAVLVIWQVASGITNLVPSVPATLEALIKGFTDGWLTAPLLDSLEAVIVGFVISAALGLPAGILLGTQRFWREVFDPIITGLFAMPRIVLYPVLLSIFSVGLASKVALAVLAAFFPIAMSTTSAIRDVDQTLVKLGRSVQCGRLALVRKIYVPAALPGIMVGIRIGLSISFISVIIAELFAAARGLGQEIQRSYGLRVFDEMFAVIFLITIIAVGGNLVLLRIERRVRAGIE
jgi:ABC-type nitrate/sulfonate/bicarbonate transport system permease component